MIATYTPADQRQFTLSLSDSRNPFGCVFSAAQVPLQPSIEAPHRNCHGTRSKFDRASSVRVYTMLNYLRNKNGHSGPRLSIFTGNNLWSYAQSMAIAACKGSQRRGLGNYKRVKDVCQDARKNLIVRRSEAIGLLESWAWI